MSMNWYVVHTYSGFENKVKLSIEEQFRGEAYEEKLGEIVVPTEQVVKVKGGKKAHEFAKILPRLHPDSHGMRRGHLVCRQEYPEGDGFSGRNVSESSLGSRDR